MIQAVPAARKEGLGGAVRSVPVVGGGAAGEVPAAAQATEHPLVAGRLGVRPGLEGQPPRVSDWSQLRLPARAGPATVAKSVPVASAPGGSSAAAAAAKLNRARGDVEHVLLLPAVRVRAPPGGGRRHVA